MEIQFKKHDYWLLVIPEEALLEENATEFQTIVEQHLGSDIRRVDVLLYCVPVIDTAGLEALITLSHIIKERGGLFNIICSMSERTKLMAELRKHLSGN